MTDDHPQDINSQDSGTPHPLSPWNPLDHLRLLWWVLVTPQQLRAYRKAYGEDAERTMTIWLFSMLVLLPFLILMLLSANVSTVIRYSLVAIILLGALWLIAIFVGLKKTLGAALAWGFAMAAWVLVALVVFVTGYSTVFDVMNGIMGYLVRSIVFILIAYLISRYCAVVIDKSIDRSVKTGSPSWLVRSICVGMLLMYTIIVWLGAIARSLDNILQLP
jgi:hypothetical protein